MEGSVENKNRNALPMAALPASKRREDERSETKRGVAAGNTGADQRLVR